MGQLIGEAGESPMLEDADCSRLLAQDSGDTFDVETTKHAEQNDLGLVRREVADTAERRLRFARGEELNFRIGGIGGLE
jgi:hypothetical protein